MAVVGVTTVFFALLSIVAVVVFNHYVSERPNRRTASAVSFAVGSAPEAEPTTDLRPLALAAYALHLRRSAFAIREPAQASRWAMAGRVRQTRAFQR